MEWRGWGGQGLPCGRVKTNKSIGIGNGSMWLYFMEKVELRFRLCSKEGQLQCMAGPDPLVGQREASWFSTKCKSTPKWPTFPPS